MLSTIIRFLATGAAIYFVPQLLKGVQVSSFTTALIVAVVMSLLNALVKPILSILAFPITVLTLGLFSFVISVIIVYLCAALVPGFRVDGFLTALLFSIILSVVNSLVSAIGE